MIKVRHVVCVPEVVEHFFEQHIEYTLYIVTIIHTESDRENPVTNKDIKSPVSESL